MNLKIKSLKSFILAVVTGGGLHCTLTLNFLLADGMTPFDATHRYSPIWRRLILFNWSTALSTAGTENRNSILVMNWHHCLAVLWCFSNLLFGLGLGCLFRPLVSKQSGALDDLWPRRTRFGSLPRGPPNPHFHPCVWSWEELKSNVCIDASNARNEKKYWLWQFWYSSVADKCRMFDKNKLKIFWNAFANKKLMF